MATAMDVHVQLMKWENRSYQQALMERAVSQDEALRRLTEMVSRNSEQIEALTELVNQNRVRIEILDEKMDRLMAHLKVPPKPPAGFVKE